MAARKSQNSIEELVVKQQSDHYSNSTLAIVFGLLLYLSHYWEVADDLHICRFLWTNLLNRAQNVLVCLSAERQTNFKGLLSALTQKFTPRKATARLQNTPTLSLMTW